jgi:ABC-type transporter MlaC component
MTPWYATRTQRAVAGTTSSAGPAKQLRNTSFHFKPLNAEERGNETVVSIEVSGSFPSSPVTLDYHFTVANDKISSLIIDS